MSEFKLDSKLDKDSFLLGNFPLCQLRLIDNALVPWFILVPRLSIIEFHCLSNKDQLALLNEINRVCGFLTDEYQPDKINTATIGNIVRQLHVHVIGRYVDDYCWPTVVWGRRQKKRYSVREVSQIREKTKAYFDQGFDND